MSTSSISGINLGDIMTRVVPGIVVISPLLVLVYYGISDLVNSNLNYAILSVLAIGFLIGETIEMIRTSLFRVPTPFSHVIYTHTKNKDCLSWRDRASLWMNDKVGQIKSEIPFFKRTKISESTKERRTIFVESNSDFQEIFESDFGLKFKDNTNYALYSAFLSHMEGKMSESTKSNRRLTIFSQNLRAALLPAIALSFYIVVVEDLSGRVLTSLVLLIIGLYCAIFFAQFVLSASYGYIDLLIIDYYVDREL